VGWQCRAVREVARKVAPIYLESFQLESFQFVGSERKH